MSATGDVQVTLDLAHDDDALDTVAAQIPDPATLDPGARVVVLATRAARGGLLARLRPPPPVPSALRASALLIRGYVEIQTEGDTVRGRA